MSLICTEGRGPGQWHRTELNQYAGMPEYGNQPSTPSAVLYCPNCGMPIGLQNHTINPDGTVAPSVVENGTAGECNTFHSFVTLAGWQPTPPAVGGERGQA